MSEEEFSSLKEVYNDLWNDARNLIKDLTRSITLYKYSGVLLLLFNIYPIYWILLWAFVIPPGLMNDEVIFILTSYFVAVALLTFFGLKLLRTYFKLKKRYLKLWKTRLDIED